MTTTWLRVNAFLLVLVLAALLALIGMLAAGVRGGPLDPSGSPAPTMKTLDEIPGSWSRRLPANDGSPGGVFPTPPAGCGSTRFQCVMQNAAVLDRETGLVWERTPDTSTMNWILASGTCEIVLTGDRRGWRLPTIEEISTLVDAQASGAPFLPTGHPFVDVQTDNYYWTSTSASGTFARAADFNLATGVFDKTTARHVWCVRGNQGYDGL